MGPGDFLMIFGGPGGRKKRLHFFKANRMKLSGTNYPLLKTENLLLIHGSISEKLSLYRFFGTQFFFFLWPARIPGGRHQAWEPSPDRELSKNLARQPDRHRARVAGDLAPGYGISVLRVH